MRYIILCIVLAEIVISCRPKEKTPEIDKVKPVIEINRPEPAAIYKPGDVIRIKGVITDNLDLKSAVISIQNSVSGEIYFSQTYSDANPLYLDTTHSYNHEDGTKLELIVRAEDLAGNSSSRSFIIHISQNGMTVRNPDSPYPLVYPERLGTPFIPEDNHLTVNRVKLGKLLFFDPILSGDSSVSCASCHNPQNSFSDPRQFSVGVGGKLGERHSMSLINLAWSNSFFWDGAALSLEAQARVPLLNPLEMNIQIDEAIRRLNNHPDYPQLFYDAYERLPDEYSLLRAIASYQRTLVSYNSRYDQFFFEDRYDALSDSEVRGWALFYGYEDKVHCGSCHSGNHFTNNAFENNGLYFEYRDQGRYMITMREADKGRFKVPTLRNIALTAPYMHDGSLKTLEEVVDFYNTGGKGHPNQSFHVHIHTPLTSAEKRDLVNFLKTLTDEKFINEHAL